MISSAEREQSLSELMSKAFFLSLNIVYKSLSPDGHYLQERDLPDLIGENNIDTIWAWADGLITKRYRDITEGRCSFKQIVDFDIVDFESKVKMQTKMMSDVLEMLGHPTKLTSEQMKALGYKWDE